MDGFESFERVAALARSVVPEAILGVSYGLPDAVILRLIRLRLAEIRP